MTPEKDDVVRVKGKKGSFRINTIIREEDGIIGYRVFDKEMRLHCYREDRIQPKKRKRKGRT